MGPEYRVVTQLPLTELWRNDGSLVATRIRDLGASDLTELLRRGPVQFVVADVGARLEWKAENECFSFWKQEVRAHLAESRLSLDLDAFPGAFAYWASQWQFTDGIVVILLEKMH